MTDPYYLTKAWRRLREVRLRLDGDPTCVVPGCQQRATVVDHIRPPKGRRSRHPREPAQPVQRA